MAAATTSSPKVSPQRPKVLAEHLDRVGKPLHFELEGKHSARRGDYQVIYVIDDQRRTVSIEAIAHRG